MALARRASLTIQRSARACTALLPAYQYQYFQSSFHASSRTLKEQYSLPASYYRGGTSRAIIFRQQDLPADRKKWDPIFLGVIGSPDPTGRQLDGMGGGISSLSKICVVGPSDHADADVDYTFVALGVKDAEVDYSSNCGNMTSAIGPFAVDQGMFEVRKDENEVVVRIHNTNTGKIIHATVPVEDGEVKVDGDFAIDGVAGTAAKIQLSFVNPGGSKTGKVLPTGNLVDTFGDIGATSIDVGNPCVFVRASDLNIDGGILPDAIDAHPSLLLRLDRVRRQAAVAMGLAANENSTPGSIPKIAMVAPPHPHTLLSGQEVDEASTDLVVRAISVGQPHRAVPITVAMALAAASRLEGSTVQRCTSKNTVDSDGITIGHSSGRLLVAADFGEDGEVGAATVFRTARKLMEGRVFWK